MCARGAPCILDACFWEAVARVCPARENRPEPDMSPLTRMCYAVAVSIPVAAGSKERPWSCATCDRFSPWRPKAASRTPPRLIFTNFLSRLLAIDFARDVLPTPGGPTRQRIGALRLPVICLTARYSMILSLTFSQKRIPRVQGFLKQ